MKNRKNNGGTDKMKTRKMIIIKGKGTKNEQRIETNIIQYYHPRYKVWMTIPE